MSARKLLLLNRSRWLRDIASGEMLAWYRGDIADGKLQAYLPRTGSTTPQVKGSVFSGAGTGACTGLLTTDTITSQGTVPTCTVNGTLTISADCWDVYVHRAGVLWAYWPGINVAGSFELDASGNGHHLYLTTTTIAEVVDGTGTNYVNEKGYSYRENLFSATIINTNLIGIALVDLGSGYYSFSKITTAPYMATQMLKGGGIKAAVTTYSVTLTLRKIPGSTNAYNEFSLHDGALTGCTARVISGPGTVSVPSMVQVAGLSETVDTVIEISKATFDIGTDDVRFYMYPGLNTSTTVGDGFIVKEMQLCEGLTPSSLYEIPPRARSRYTISTRGGYPNSLGAVVCIGDSLTTGYIQYIRLTNKRTTFLDKGVGGNTSAQVLARFSADVVTTGGTHCIIFVGINDILGGVVSAAGIMANISACVDIADANGIGVTLSEVSPCGTHTSWTEGIQTKIEELNALINAYGSANGIRVAPMYNGMLSPGTDNLLTAYDNGDGLHFNALGSENESFLFNSVIPFSPDSASDISQYAIASPGPLNVSATITAGTTYPAITVTAPLGPEFQEIAEWTGGAAVDLSDPIASRHTRVGSRGMFIYNQPLSYDEAARADRYLGYTSPSGLVHLWSAREPTAAPYGPQSTYSAASQQPDINGTLVNWPNYVSGEGVRVSPAYTQLAQNSKLLNAVAGSPGTGPDNWTYSVVDSPTMAVTARTVGNSLRFSGTASRGYLAINQAMTALSVYTFSFKAVCDGVLQIDEIQYCSLTGGTIVVSMDGVVVADENAVPAAGIHTFSIKITAGAAGDTATFRFGLGASAVATGIVTVYEPQLTISSYVMPYAATGVGETAAIASTAATSAGAGLSVADNAEITAALGGVFTAVVLVKMLESSAEVTADSNLLAVNNNITGGIYMAAGGVLKASDGVNTCTVTVAGGWANGEQIFIPWWINGAGTNQQIGYKKSSETAITWGTAAAYDGSVNPGTHLRYGYTIDKPIGIIQSQLWNKSVGTDAEILDLLRYA